MGKYAEIARNVKDAYRRDRRKGKENKAVVLGAVVSRGGRIKWKDFNPVEWLEIKH